MALWDDVKKNLVEWYTITTDKTAEAAKIGTRRWDKFGISRDIERQFSELGSLVYAGLKDGDENILEQEAVREVVSRIEHFEEELSAKVQEIEKIKAEYARTAAAAGAAAAASPAGAADEASGEEGHSVSETVLKDPVLEVGTEDSAILVEPVDRQDVQDTFEDVAEDGDVIEEHEVSDQEATEHAASEHPLPDHPVPEEKEGQE